MISALPQGGNVGGQAGGAAEFDWGRFIRGASNQEILEYLESGDLTRADLQDLEGRCADVRFFEGAWGALNRRHVFYRGVWSWGVYHMHEGALKQLLPQGLPGVVRSKGWRFPPVSPLMEIEGGDVGYRHLEYWPWVNPYSRPIPQGRPWGGGGAEGGREVLCV